MKAIRLSALHPRPASIDLGAGDIAHIAVTRLMWRIQHKNEPPARIMVNPRLVPGEVLNGEPHIGMNTYTS